MSASCQTVTTDAKAFRLADAVLPIVEVLAIIRTPSPSRVKTGGLRRVGGVARPAIPPRIELGVVGVAIVTNGPR